MNRQDFLHCLENVQAGLSPKPTVQQSDCFVFKGGEAHTFNGEIACRVTSPLPKELEAAVHGQPLLEILRKLIEEEITVEKNDSHLLLKGQSRRSGIRLEKDILLPIDKVERPVNWKKLNEDFTEAVRLVAPCCGKDDSKWVLTHLHVTPTYMEASDHLHHLCRYTIKTRVQKNVLLKATALKQIVNLEMCDFSETENWMHFRNSMGLVYSVLRTVDNFLDFSSHLDVRGAKISLPKGLDEAVDMASIFSNLGENEEHEVRVDLHPQKGIRIRGEGVSGYYQEIKQARYDGEPISFQIRPDLLVELCKNYQEAVVNDGKLMVDTGKFRYVTCLRKVED